MPTFNEAGLVNEFQQLKVRSLDGGSVEAALTSLVARVVESAKAVSPVGWEMHVRSVRGKLKMDLASMSVAEPVLPDKSHDPMNITQRAFFAEAIARLTAAQEPVV